MSRAVHVLAVVSLLLAAATVRAESSDEERAHEIFVRADADYRLGHFEAAAAGYTRAYELAHAPAILYDVAQANRRWFETGNTIEPLRRAYDAYRAFLRDEPDSPQRGNAEREVARLRAKLVTTESGPSAVLLAEKLLAEGDADDASRLLARRLAEHGLSRAELVTALEASGRARARAGDRAGALDRFERALTIDPLVTLGSDGGAVANDAWAAAQARLAAHGPLALERDAGSSSPVTSTTRVTVRVRDPLHLVSSLSLHTRRPGGPDVIAEERPDGRGVATLEVPASVAAPAGRIGWFVVAFDAGRVQLATLGSPDAPLELVTTAERPRWYRRPWVWATIGAAALIGGAAIGLGVYFGERTTPPAFPVPTQ